MKFNSRNNTTLTIAIILFIALFIYNINLGINALESSTFQFISMLKIVPPIFILIGLMDVWVPRETMMKLMGEKSGLRGITIAFLFGTFSAGPLIGAFPVAAIMLKKGARYANVLFFLMIWASAKMPILFFQITTLGLKFTLITNLILIIIYLVGTFIIEKMMTTADKKLIYSKASEME